MTSESRKETIEPSSLPNVFSESKGNNDFAGELSSPDVDNSAPREVGSGMNFPGS
jgi:hypothetical protein